MVVNDVLPVHHNQCNGMCFREVKEFANVRLLDKPLPTEVGKGAYNLLRFQKAASFEQSERFVVIGTNDTAAVKPYVPENQRDERRNIWNARLREMLIVTTGLYGGIGHESKTLGVPVVRKKAAQDRLGGFRSDLIVCLAC